MFLPRANKILLKAGFCKSSGDGRVEPPSKSFETEPSTSLVRTRSVLGRSDSYLVPKLESSPKNQPHYIRPDLNLRGADSPIPALRVSERWSCNF